MVDCSHANSRKDHRRQPEVARSVRDQILDGNDSIIGLMIESHLHEGSQPLTDPGSLRYGVSITDACIGWEATEALLVDLAESLRSRLRERAAPVTA